MACLLRLSVLVVCCISFGRSASFLEAKLPLKVTVTTPYNLLSSSSVELDGLQTLTVVFSRPVQALGSGFGTSPTPDQVPFSLSCGIPGRFRWVTTFIARFDPSIPWPPDLSCKLQWNKRLTAYDGATLQLDTLRDVTLTTPPLTMSLSSVTSAKAIALTDGLWESNVGTPSDKLPEVPPDGSISLRFSYPVDLKLLEGALKVYKGADATKLGKPLSSLKFKAGNCSAPSDSPFAGGDVAVSSSMRMSSSISGGPSPGPSVDPACVQLNFTGSLKADSLYQLCLPAGSTYFRFAGKPSKPVCTRIAGLRPFRIPFSDFSNGESVSYRRLDLWLPHGLQPNTRTSRLASAISLCKQGAARCTPEPFTVSLPNKGTLRLTVPALQPAQKYRLSVKASSNIKDGFGQPLQASSATFTPGTINPALQGLEHQWRVLTLEAGLPTNRDVYWPFLAYSKGEVNTAAFWGQGAAGSRLPGLVQLVSAAGDLNARTLLGNPDGSVPAVASRSWYRMALNMSAATDGPWAVHTCCNTVEYPTRRQVSADQLVVQRAGVHASAVVAGQKLHLWVTSASGPVVGMAFDIYKTPYQEASTPSKIHSGTTDASGLATWGMTASDPGSYSLTAVLKPAGASPLLLPDIPTSYTPDSTEVYQAALALDKMLVREDETVYVSGVLRKQGSSTFDLPAASATFSLSVTPSPSPSSDAPATFPLEIDPEFGTFAYPLKIPKGSRYTAYTVQLQHPGPAQVSGSQTFTVADPRPPTVALKLTHRGWVAPTGKLPIRIQTVSYLGNAVSEAPVGVAWTVGSLSGVLNLTTDAAGVASGLLDLAAVIPPGSKPPEVGTTLQLTAQWIGPTRERVVQESAPIMIAEGRYTVTVTRSLPTTLPGVPFFLTALLQDNEDPEATPAQGGEVTATIEAPLATSKPPCKLPAACSFPAGSTTFSKCSLQLPCQGNFVLRACYKGSCSSTPLGMNSTEWTLQPLSRPEEITLQADKQAYVVGGTATLTAHLPRPASAVLLVVANANGVTTKVLEKVPAGLFTTTLELDSKLAGGATVQLVAHLPRSNMPAPKVPTSVLYDFNAPTSLFAQASLTVDEDRELKVNITAPSTMAPGEKAKVSVKVEGAPRRARITLLAVDQSLLDLIPYPLPKLYDQLQLRLATSVDTTDLLRSTTSMAAVEAIFRAALARLTTDPWISASDLVSTQQFADRLPVDTPAEELLARYTSPLTLFPSRPSRSPMRSRGGEGLIAMAAAGGTSNGPQPAMTRTQDSTAAAEATTAPLGAPAPTGAGGAGPAVRVESEFKSTPLFKVLTAEAGEDGQADFTAPMNLGTFALRAFVATGKDTKVGSAEAKVVVRRNVSVTPSVPRFVRSGDTFEAGVVVTVVSAEAAVPVSVTVQLASGAKATLQSTSDKQSVTLSGAAKQKEVRFRFLADTSVGEVKLVFSASDGAGGEDAVEASLPVAPLQEQVVLGTSFAINASTSDNWQEGIELPGAVPGSGALQLTASAGYLAAVQSSFEQVANDKPDIPEGYWSVAVAAYPGALSQYKQPLSGPTASAVGQGLQWIQALNTPRLGLLPYPATYGYYPQRVDIYLNSWASWLLSAYSDSALDPALPPLAPAWANAAGRQLAEDAAEYRKWSKEPWGDLELLAWVRLSLGTKWTPDPVPNLPASDLAWERLTANLTALSQAGRCLVALTLQKEGAPTSNPTIQEVTKQLQSALRTQGRTAYVAVDPTSASAAGMEEQALALLVLTQAGVDSPLIQKLAAYVSANKPPAPVLWSITPRPSPRPAATTHLALTTYDRATGNLSPDLTLAASAASAKLLEAKFNSPSDPPANSSTPWEDLPPSAKTLDFQATGKGQASIAATMTFVPNKVLGFPTYRGIWVQRAYQAVAAGTGEPVGARLARVKLSSLVAVTVQLTTPDDIPDVEVRVLLPGGLEPIDPSVYSDSAAQLTCTEGDQAASVSRLFPFWWWPICPSQETRPQVVTFRYPRLTAGTHNIKFLAVAASVGKFLDPPSKAFSTQQPELMGLSGAGLFEVCDGSTCRAKLAPLRGPPKECNSGCSGNGVCNLTTGACFCDRGFSGVDCSVATS